MFPAKLLLYVLILLLGFIGPFLFKLRTDGIFACPADGYTGNRYLAYCGVTGYGDYDHGAFWFGLEPDTYERVREADVLFLGSSRLQFAFSSQTTEDWFSSPSTRYYLLGFSFTENVTFTGQILSKIQPTAKVYVINVDRFFLDEETQVGKDILRAPDAEDRTKQKHTWQQLHRPLCGTLPTLCGTEASFYRLRDTGAWQFKGIRNWGAKPVSVGPPDDRESWGRYAEIGRRFLASLPVDRHCILLTMAPYHDGKQLEADAIAQALGSELIVPQADNLITFDGSHLDRPSAERWSRAFFDSAGPRIRACLNEARTSPHSTNGLTPS